MRIDVYLVEGGYTASRTEAKNLILSGAVTVNGVKVKKPSFDVSGDEDITVDTSMKKYVSRGGLKLEGAISEFDVEVDGKTAIDIGASSGGFTDCLLRHGAKSVICVDSGTNQLVEKLREDDRITVLENYNARYLSRDDLPYIPEIAVMDVSFISATYIIRQIYECLANNGDFICLIKPQFEVGKAAIGKGGIVKSEAQRRRAIDKVTDFAKNVGFSLLGVIKSPIEGGDGNVEYLAHFKKQMPTDGRNEFLMKKIAVIPNPSKDIGLNVTRLICQKLLKFKREVYIDKKHATDVDHSYAYDTFPSDVDLIVVVGGDGSILDASVIAIEVDVPVLGVNLGKVGYLSEVEPDNLDILERIFSEDFKIEEKMLLSVSSITEKGIETCTRLAVNDVIISHDNFLGIADFRLETGNSECVRYRADGMILSTPAGCTAYSLSAGGPIVAHDVDSIVATPICPHSFFNRSIIFKPSEELKILNESKTPLNISVDGRYFSKIENNEQCIIKQADKKLKMLTFNESNMFSTLFKKMKLLEDIT